MMQFITFERVLLFEAQHWFSAEDTLDLTQFIRQSSNSSVSSISYLRTTTHDLSNGIRALLQLFDRLEERRDFDRLCHNHRTKMPVCTPLVLVIRGGQVAFELAVDLALLEDSLSEATAELDAFARVGEGSMLCSADLADRLLRMDMKALWEGEVRHIAPGRAVVELALFGE